MKVGGWVFLLSCFTAACSAGSSSSSMCTSNAQCGAGRTCLDGQCVPGNDGGREDATAPLDAGGADASTCEAARVCASSCCREGERCVAATCVPDLGPCTVSDDCRGDSYCDETNRCTPYGVPPTIVNDPSCTRPITLGSFAPEMQCRWTGTVDGSAYASWNKVYSTPMVADLDLDDQREVISPSIMFASFDDLTQGGVLRVLDGRTCAQQIAMLDPADRLIYASSLAIADIDRAPDGRPEIVGTSLMAPDTGGGLIAFGVDPSSRTLRRLWYGRRCDLPGEPRHTPNQWLNNNGPSIHDLDDDGDPEILFDRFVYTSDGCVLNPSQPYSNYLLLGLYSVVSNVDGDPAPELVAHDGVYEWSTASRDWVRETYWAPPAGEAAEAVRVGHVAIADLGDFPGAVGDAPGRPEIVVAYAPAADSPASADGFVRVMTIGGDIVFGPLPLPNEPGQLAGRGGPPTIGDFDGDGRREFAVAGASRYTVFDLDCPTTSGASAPGCTRAAGLPGGVLWSRPSQDHSSNVTGSSVFDFDADGVAEAVYADECYLRVYRGTDGEVLYSSSASSSTGYELPVIADVDGDFNTEIVVALSPDIPCPATDPIYTRGTSTFVNATGIVVMRDAEDKWAASRPIWNQHAYHVTHVSDSGAIPRTSEWTPNHTAAGLNNFRMNAQGSLERAGAADLTVALSAGEDLCDASGEVVLRASVCNRGTNPVADGARVVFYAGEPGPSAAIRCETALPRLLIVGACTEVSCTATIGAGATTRDTVVVVDPDDSVLECRDGNNRGEIPASACPI